jgi:murein DD-endopeptidase MepM/ murein hydrolase activator NlpD
MAFSPRARILLLSASILFGLTALVWYLSSRPRPMPVTPIPQPNSTAELGATPLPPHGATPQTGESAPPSSAASTPAVEASSSPASTPTPDVNSAAPPVPTDAANSATTGLLIPVAGVRPEQLQDTYTQSRSEGRTHNAIDIMAARNTPVVAAADGRIIKLFQSERGGITLYQLGTDNRTVYYYAHLERYADGLAENRFARRGELLGYVGDSGNAGRDNCHLHFSIWLITDPKRFWDGENLNPYPLLTKR